MRIKLIQVGLGSFGWNWFVKTIIPSKEIELIGVVDKNEVKLAEAASVASLPKHALFTSLSDALQVLKPEFILNVTPPHAHLDINEMAFAHRIPVLSEKPISDSYEEAVQIYQTALERQIPFMIAENFRFQPAFRHLKELLNEKVIGHVSRLDVSFFKQHKMFNYHQSLKHPLLLDVTIHHLDVMRYLLGCEAASVYADSWLPPWSWYQELSNANLSITWESGVHTSYRGSLDASNGWTDWNGTWRIEGDQGVLRYDHGRILLNDNEVIIPLETEPFNSQTAVLNEFISALKEGRHGETDIRDNWHTFELTYAAIRSIHAKHAILIPKGGHR